MKQDEEKTRLTIVRLVAAPSSTSLVAEVVERAAAEEEESQSISRIGRKVDRKRRRGELYSGGTADKKAKKREGEV